MKKMKKATALGLAALTGLAACDLTENIVTGVTSSYYETPAGLEDAVKATYSFLHWFYAQEIHMTMTELGTDLWVKGSDGSFKHFNDYTAALNATTGPVNWLWNDSYQAINTANAVITRAPNTSGLSEELRSRRIAEARFLRALFYFNLVRTYGDVHITLEETVGVETEARRSPAAEVYQVIIDDLTFAEQNLPVTQPQDGRATRGAAQHLLSLVYLTRAASGDLERALEKAEAVIAGPYQLVPNWISLFDIGNQKNSEVVFAVQFTNDPLTRGNGNRFHLYFLMEYDVLPGMHRVLHYGRPWKRLRPTEKLLRLYDRDADSRFWDSFQRVWFAKRADDARGIAVGDPAVYLPHGTPS
jgi:starch-binding outer membrane protein, SusD/RagB family